MLMTKSVDFRKITIFSDIYFRKKVSTKKQDLQINH